MIITAELEKNVAAIFTILLPLEQAPSGIAWSPDCKTMYFIDTPTREVRAFEYDIETGNIANPEVTLQNSLPSITGAISNLAGGAVRQEETADLKLVTGASAGSLNALLSVLVACGGEAPSSPADSLFWHTWIPIGFEQLSAAPPGALGAFSRRWLERQAAQVEQAWNAGIDASCDLVVGVSTTRVEPRILRAASGRLELPRMEERFAIRIRGRGPGRPPLATNYVGAGGPLPSPLLVTNADGEIAFSELRNLLFASMAFPVAFAPQPVRTCLAGQTAVAGVCLASEAETTPYVDGGIFDNAPIRMAVGLARAGLEPSPDAPGHLVWRRAPDPSSPNDLSSVVFGFVDPDATEYPSAPRRKTADEQPSLVRELRGISESLVDTTRSKELATLMEEHPEISDRIVLPRRHFPAASAPMFAFLGFFETEFRAFDFQLGMYDGTTQVLGTAQVGLVQVGVR